MEEDLKEFLEKEEIRKKDRFLIKYINGKIYKS